MPVSMKVLKRKGLTPERLKKIFTAEPPKDYQRKFVSRFNKGDGSTAPAIMQPGSDIYQFPENPTDWDIREFFETRIQNRLEEAWERNIDGFRLYSAVDLAMDSTPINKFNWPLQLLAQGHLNLEQCHKQISELSSEMAAQIFEKDSSGKPFKVNVPKFTEISHNLVHSLVTRRVAAVGTPISTRFPFLKYDPRSTSLEGKLKAELMTQRAEIMSDQFGYRHDVVQTIRDVSCYAHQVEFCRSSWTKETQDIELRKKVDGATGVGAANTDTETKEVVVKEGVEFVAPHPSRVFWDIAHPLAKLNFDCGPSYVGYWDVTRYADIRTNTGLYNRDAVEIDPAAYEFLTNNQAYFQIYYPDTIIFPTKERLGNLSSMANDRLYNTGFYSVDFDDMAVTVSEYFEKVVPSEWGIANYDGPVWIRFVVAGVRTVIFAEVLPSLPACVYHYNENDSRLYSPSFAHQVMPYQDQISNLLSQLLEIQLQGLTKIYELNKDGMEAADIATVEESLKVKRYDAAKSVILKYSAQTLRDMGMDPDRTQRIRAIEIETSEKVTEIFKSIIQLLSFAERLLFFSPQELGQVAPREITATEANIVNNTTLGIRDFHTLGIEEGLAAKKRIIAEASVCLGSDEITLPVLQRFPRSVIEKAGFTIVETDGDPETTETAKTGYFTISGSSEALLYDYVFTTRDGLDRPNSTQVANSLIQLLQVVSQSPALSQSISKESMVALGNEIARNIGTGFDVKFALPEGSNPEEPVTPDPMKQVQEVLMQFNQAITNVFKQQEKQQSDIANMGKMIQAIGKQVSQVLPTREGEVAPGIPRGAPPLNGAVAPQEVAFLQ